MPRRRAHRDDAVQSVTGAQSGRSEDVAIRTRHYLVSMGVRTVCLIAAVVTHGPLRWVFVAAAVALPYFAVVIANAAVRRTPRTPPSAVLPTGGAALDPGRVPRTDDTDRPR